MRTPEEIKDIQTHWLVAFKELGRMNNDVVHADYEVLLDTLAVAGLPDLIFEVKKELELADVVNELNPFDYSVQLIYIIAYYDVLLKHTSLDTKKLTDDKYSESLLIYLRKYQKAYDIAYAYIDKLLNTYN